MYYYTEFDPYLIRERNEQMRVEMSKLRLEKRLREAKADTSRLVAYFLRLTSTLHPLRGTGTAGR